MSIPQNDMPEATSMPAGKWKIKFGGEGSNAHAKVRIQTTSDGTFHGGSLDLHLHIPAGLRLNGRTVSATNAANNGDMSERVGVFYNELKRAFGIDRGKVSFHAASADLVTLNDEAAQSAAGAVSKGFPDAQSAHLLLANDLQNGDLLGLSPGIPGAITVAGTAVSGIMAALYDGVSAQEDGNTWLHELGHFIGLQHTSESDGVNFDALADTAKCPGIGNGDTSSCPDESNLMFPTIFAGTPKVSKAQQIIFRGSPIYKTTGTTAGARRRPELASTPAAPPRSTTLSGRALKPVEQWLGRTFCGASSQSPRALVAARGQAQAIADLEEVAAASDLPQIYRTKAARMLERVVAGEAGERSPLRLWPR
jgi:hypothetical protein